MSYKIIGDSCLDLTPELKKDLRFETVPLTLQVDSHIVADDDTFDQAAFLELVRKSPNCPKSACPSPGAFKEACECGADDIYIITISSHLSGSYESAVLGKSLYEEEHGAGSKNILVIDSESASSGQLNIALRICEMYSEGLCFAEIEKRILKMRTAQKTYFVIDSLEPLRKNGRLTGLQAFFATALNIKPVMGSDRGVIIKLEQARGLKKSLDRMCRLAAEGAVGLPHSRAVVAHCNCPERAELVRHMLEDLGKFREIVITQTAGVSTLYAGDGGIVLAVGA